MMHPRTRLCARLDSGYTCVPGAGDVNRRGGSGAELGLASRIRGSESGQRVTPRQDQKKRKCLRKTHPSAKYVELCGALCEERERTLPSRSPHSQPIFISRHRIGGKEGFLFHTASTVLAAIQELYFITSGEASEQVIRGGPQKPRLWLSAIHTHLPLNGTEVLLAEEREAQKCGASAAWRINNSYFRLPDKDEDKEEREHTKGRACTRSNVKQTSYTLRLPWLGSRLSEDLCDSSRFPS
ncbi:hypothetical protein H4582DRAFT_2053810 [Lactarius indigo]|nr:hypothetical protein H4582DRAFT_2053810 [Lactarius indigo]